MRISESGPAWTRTRDLFLIRDNSVCHSCSPPFKKCCKPALFLPTSVLCVHHCSGALSSNCRQPASPRKLTRSRLPRFSVHPASVYPLQRRWLELSLFTGSAAKGSSGKFAVLLDPAVGLFIYPLCSPVGSLRGLPEEACNHRSLFLREAFLNALHILDVGPQVPKRLLKPRLCDEHQRAPTVLGIGGALDVPPRLQPVDHGRNGSGTYGESLTQTLLSHGPCSLQVLECCKF